MTDLGDLLRALDRPVAPDPAFAARVTDAFVAAALGTTAVTAPAPRRGWRGAFAMAAAAAAIVGVVGGVALVRSAVTSDQEPVTPPTASTSPAPTPTETIAPPRTGWGRPVAAPQNARDWAVDVWTGDEWFFWSGIQDCEGCDRVPRPTGALYDPATGRWRPTAPAPVTTGRAAGTAVWTGSRVLVWGGFDDQNRQQPPLSYDPVADRWERLPAAPIDVRAHAYRSQAVWTGTELVVWGGSPITAEAVIDPSQPDVGAAYNPATKGWRVLPRSPITSFRDQFAMVWTGDEVLVWGGAMAGEPREGAAYDPATDRWRTIPTAPLPVSWVAAWGWTGRELLVWGGMELTQAEGTQVFRNDGAAYDPATDRWRSLPAAPLTGRLNPATAMAGPLFFLWGGRAAETFAPFTDGAVFNTDTGRWTALPPISGITEGGPGPRAVWTGEEVLVFGGRPDSPRTEHVVVSYRP